MRLEDCEVRPGVVLRVEDEFGTIKASCPGMFSEEDDPDMLPPVYPFIQSSGSSFNQPHEDDPIFVWSNDSNPLELFYTFRFNVKNTGSSSVLSKKPKDAEILVSRDSGLSTSDLYYTAEDGWILKNDSSKFQIDKEKNISISKEDPHRTIEVNDEGISLGSAGGSAEPAVLGNKLSACLMKLYAGLKNTAESMKGNPYTAAAGAELSASIEAFKRDINKICSSNVTLD